MVILFATSTLDIRIRAFIIAIVISIYIVIDKNAPNKE